MPKLSFKALSPEEFGLIPTDALRGMPAEILSGAVVAVDEAGAVVAMCGLISAIHLDPVWIREDHRNSPNILRRLWESTRQSLAVIGVRGVIGVATTPLMRKLCKWAGGMPIEGQQYVIAVNAGKVGE